MCVCVCACVRVCVCVYGEPYVMLDGYRSAERMKKTSGSGYGSLPPSGRGWGEYFFIYLNVGVHQGFKQ